MSGTDVSRPHVFGFFPALCQSITPHCLVVCIFLSFNLEMHAGSRTLVWTIAGQGDCPSALPWLNTQRGPRRGARGPTLASDVSVDTSQRLPPPPRSQQEAGLTTPLSVKITDLLLAETEWAGAQHRQQRRGAADPRAHHARSDPRRPAGGDEPPSTPCSPVCPTTEALSLWGILEDTFKATRIW